MEGLAKALRSNTTEGIDTSAAGGTSVESRQAAYGFNRCSPVTPNQSSVVSARRGVISSVPAAQHFAVTLVLLTGCCWVALNEIHELLLSHQQVQSGAAEVVLFASDRQPEGPNAHTANGGSHGEISMIGTRERPSRPKLPDLYVDLSGCVLRRLPHTCRSPPYWVWQ